MDTQRLILFFVFSFSILLLWEAWQKEAKTQQQPAPASSVPAAPTPSSPAKQAQGPVSAPADRLPTAAAQAVGAQGQRERIKVKTDALLAEVDTLGGNLVYLELLRHKDQIDENKNFVLLTPEHRYAAESGLIGPGLPNHKTLYASRVKELNLVSGQDRVELRLDAPEVAGLKVSKILTFRRGSYLIDIAYEVSNGSQASIDAYAYYQLARDGKPPPGDSAMMPTFTGVALFSEHDKYVKMSFSDVDKGKIAYSKNSDNGWVGVVQHYFVSTFLPAKGVQREFYTRKLGEDYYAAGVIVPMPAIAPGATQTVSVPLYAGPQEQDKLKAIASGLELVVDYGWLTIIAAPLFWVLQVFHGWAGNWGLAIILLTVVIKLVFFPLSAASYRSMAKMKLVTPRLTKLREQYGDDRARMNQAMMELYKTEKINPLGGCLPILVQIPVFIALYWVLLAAIELRHAPFYGWIADLASPDPWYVLPALMMASMILQTKMNPTPPDPVQAKVMMIMPFAFGVMFFFFPAGLVLYWVVNNILSIIQQWQINRMMGDGKAATRR